MASTPAVPAAPPLDGCVVAFRGSFPGHKQADLSGQATRLGARVRKSLTKDATHLITTQSGLDEPSSKVYDARERGIHIVSIDWLLDSEESNSRQPETLYSFDTNTTTATTTNDGGAGPVIAPTPPPPTSSKKRQASPSTIDSSPEAKPQPKKTKLDMVAEKDKTPALGQEQIAKSWDVQVPLDEYCHLSGYGVHIDDDSVIWDASLNQTNAGHNNNKFYRIQLLINPANHCQTWTRWGRVGERGQSSTLGNGSLSDAKTQFEKKFKDKTGLTWENRTADPKPKKYVFLEKCYQPESDDDDVKPAGEANEKGAEIAWKPPSCTLDLEVQKLMELIFNQKYFAAAMTDLNYDVNKLPLGRLSKATIMRGFQTLKDLSETIDNPAGRYPVEDLSNLYYSLIPHNFGRNRPPVINNQATVKREIELLENLADMKDATNILKAEIEGRGSSMHPLDRQYLGLGLDEMAPLDPKSVEFQLLGEYLMNTRGHTHHANYSIESIFRIERHGEKERFIANKQSDRRLLWHGSRATNFGGILSQGLRIAPPEAPANGYMFGKGVYLADMSSKSANYCCSGISDGTALLLLCEADLGTPMLELTGSDYNAGEHAKSQGLSSTWGKGLTGPSVWKDASCVHPSLAGIKMPDTSRGPPGPTGVQNAYLKYNEYICYDVSQIRLRYLLRVKM
ncbi:hypothetical protein VMCG_05573 [Cytospora schulzeri]|uniref:Poly [ADP-ribose] polymerase n=1 Tax=Cytospora schulzeri TaxID=448051 RepID=A0A423WEQ1_9PEZI|nr:hypothetical protein VMCG_05573 [Valsa malicola]